jgi:DnaJ homolog subfamily A member 2
MKGRLYIQFNVEFPDSGLLTADQCHSLEKALPTRPTGSASQLSDMELDECEETILTDVNMEEEMRRKQQHHHHGEAYDEDDDDAGPRVQCAQQ